MDTQQVRELLDVVLRWMHLAAGILWIGNSMLFNWLDRNLIRPADAPPEEQGAIWLLHSGAFYEVKKKFLRPHEMPAVLHWFKWQAYTTWLTGIALLVLVYHLDGGLLVDPQVMRLSPRLGTAVGLGSLLVGFGAYDSIWRSRLARWPGTALVVSLALLAGVAVGLSHVLAGRAAYIHVGALLGSCMVGNVFHHIMPSQRALVRATELGQAQDRALAARAKQRSIHNNYMTFPVLFIMLSSHFPSTYGARLNGLVLGVAMAGGAGVRHFMNVRFHDPRWRVGLSLTVVATLAGLVLLTRAPASVALRPAAGERVDFATVNMVVRERCLPCHSSHPSDEVWKMAPAGVVFDTAEQIRAHAERIKARAVVSKTMPLANKTGMTAEERDLLARWLYGGARID